jgi:hypothetical protein
MTLDPFTVAILTGLVVNVGGGIFILETLLRRDEKSSRLWALGFLAAMLTTLAYIVWAGQPEAWWAIAAGNATFVAGTGCMWLGCRRYNERPMLVPGVLVVIGVVGAAVAVVIAGPDGGAWAGAVWMFVALAIFAAAGAVESSTGVMGSIRTSWGLAIVLGIQSLYLAARTVAFLTIGPQDPFFELWFSTTSTSFVTITLTIVAVVVTSVLRARRAPLRGYGPALDVAPGDDGVVSTDAFRHLLKGIAARAAFRRELLTVICVRIDDLEQISTAFGSEIARSVAEAWREGVRRHASSLAVVGEDGLSGLLVAVLATSPTDARRQAAVVYRGLFDDLGGVAGGVIPVVGVGVALSDAVGYDDEALVRVARDAARRAALSVESSVLVGEEQRVSGQ